MAAPTLKIGGIAITAQNFTWSATAGTQPFTTSVTVPKPISQELSSLQNPVEIELEMDGFFAGKPATLRQKISYVYLLERREIDAFSDSWTMADIRFLLRNKITTCSYNKTRIKNTVVSGANTIMGEPSELRTDFDIFSAGRYLPWSVKGDGKPYTMKEILDIEIKKAIPWYTPNNDADDSYYLENIEYIGTSTQIALSGLLNLTRYQMGVDYSGNLYIFPIDYPNMGTINSLLMAQKERVLRGSRLYKQERSRMRPKKIAINFEKKQEVWLTYVPDDTQKMQEGGGEDTWTEGTAWSSGDVFPGRTIVPAKEGLWDGEAYLDGRVIAVYNVLPIPYPITIGTKEYLAGEFVTMETYLQAIGLTEADVRTWWFEGQLESRLSYLLIQRTTDPAATDATLDLQARVIVSALRSHYRQTFQIDPAMMDIIQMWDARRIGIVDNFSHFSPPSPVWADYSVVPHIRHAQTAKRLVSWNNSIRVWEVDTYDARRALPTAGTISVVNQSLGIFKISYPATIYSAIKDIIPFAIDVAPGINIGSFNNGSLDPCRLSDCRIKQNFQMQTIVSVVWSIDPRTRAFDTKTANTDQNIIDAAITGGGVTESKKFYQIGYPIPEGENPVVYERICREEYARYAIPPYSSGVTGLVVVNEGIIQALGRSEASRILQQFNDYYTGRLEMAGLVTGKLTGNMSSWSIEFGPEGVSSTVEFSSVSPYTIEQKLEQQGINYLKRHVSRGDSINDLRTI